MKRIKLLYAIGSTSGGALKHVTDLATHIDQKSFEIFVVMSNKKQVIDTKIAISKIKKKNIDICYIYIANKISFTDIISFFRIYSFLKKHKFDIVHAHSSKAGALFRLAAFCNKPLVVMYTPHCFYFTACKGIKRSFYQALEYLLGRITHHVVISGTEQKAAEECKIAKEKISIIDNGINFNDYNQIFSLSDIYKSLGLPFNHTVIIGVGRLVKQKKWNMFIDVAKVVISKNKDITFIIAGDGPCKKYLLKYITKSGLNAHIKMIGYIEDISKIYSIADIFISTSKWEGLPYTYLEALYFDIPMIITYTEGIEYFVQKSNCIYMASENVLHFAYKILDTMTLLSNKLSVNKTYPFSLSDCIKQYETLYQALSNLHNK